MSVRLGDVVAALEALYPPSLAEDWDAVGLVVGDPEAQVSRVLFAIDPVAAVVDEAADRRADLLVTHHPLFLRGTTSVAATTPKGRVVHRLVAARCGLFVAHTNADVAAPGVSDALAAALGLVDLEPLRPVAAGRLDKLVVYVPEDATDRLLDALSAAGAGAIGAYDRCAWTTTGEGTFRPLPGASPTVGEVGEVVRLREARLEMVLPRRLRAQVVRAMRAAHPYEEPAFDLLELAPEPGPLGIGRVGRLSEPVTLEELTRSVAAALPATPVGVRGSGDPLRVVERLAVSGGAGDDLLDEAGAAGADAFVTGDLRHHRSLEAPEGLALVDAGHWATEWPWLADAAARLAHAVTVDTAVSTLVTDPWTTHARSTAL